MTTLNKAQKRAQKKPKESTKETWSIGDTVATLNKAQVGGERGVFDDNTTRSELLAFQDGKTQIPTFLCQHTSFFFNRFF